MGLTPPELGWSRGCGNGIGYSAHKNTYQPGVAIDNFLEDRANRDMQQAGVNMFGFQQPGNYNTCYRQAYHRSAQAYAQALQDRTAEIPRQLIKEDKGKKALLDQEDPGGGQAPTPYTTVNSLAFASPSLDKTALHTELWSGRKANDLGITLREKKGTTATLSGPAPGSLRAQKSRQWARDCVPERKSQYATVAGTLTAEAATRAALVAAEAVSDGRPAATASSQADIAARAAAGGSHASMVGRKAKGEFVDAADLKETMYRKMYFRHPVLHTVQWQTQAEVDAAAALKSSAAWEGAAAVTTEADAAGGTGEDAEQCADLQADGQS